MNELPGGYEPENLVRKPANLLERGANRILYALWQDLEKRIQEDPRVEAIHTSRSKRPRPFIARRFVRLYWPQLGAASAFLMAIGTCIIGEQYTKRDQIPPALLKLAQTPVGGFIAPFPTPQVSVSEEQTKPIRSEYLNGIGSYAIYKHGVVVNEVEGLTIQVFPEKLDVLSDIAGLRLSNDMIITRIVRDQALNDADMVKLNTFARTNSNNQSYVDKFTQKTGLRPNNVHINVIPWVSVLESVSRRERIEADLTVTGLSSELSQAWFNRIFASIVLQMPDLNLPRIPVSESDRQMVAKEMPFWVVR